MPDAAVRRLTWRDVPGSVWALGFVSLFPAARRRRGALEPDYPNFAKFARGPEFSVYLAENRGGLINYGERLRAGERISSAMAKSTANAVVSKRSAQRQWMQWTKRGAHLPLQTRTRALDGTLRPLFERWHPGLANDNQAGAGQAETA